MADIDASVKTFVEIAQRQDRMTHAAVVIAAAAILDNQLERALKRAMRPLSKKQYARLFDSFGPLSNFAGKIVMAYALEIIPDETYAELEKIRVIRNVFAHATSVLHLESSEVKGVFISLRRPDTASTKPVQIFLDCVKVIDEHLDAYLARTAEPSA
jgi:DNA-binding MltR family transcriptional regulator